MSRGDGFDRMDVSISIDDDPKFRLHSRRYPDRLAIGVLGYFGVLAHSSAAIDAANEALQAL